MSGTDPADVCGYRDRVKREKDADCQIIGRIQVPKGKNTPDRNRARRHASRSRDDHAGTAQIKSVAPETGRRGNCIRGRPTSL